MFPDGWVEEVDLLEEEMRRLKRSCEKMEQVWKTLPLSTSINLRYVNPKSPINMAIAPSAGCRAYAAQKASMYKTMAEDAQRLFTEVAKGGYTSSNESLSEYVKRNRPRLTVDWEKEALEQAKAEEEALKREKEKAQKKR